MEIFIIVRGKKRFQRKNISKFELPGTLYNSSETRASRCTSFSKCMQGMHLNSQISLVEIHCTEKSTCYEPLGFIELAEKFGEFSRMKYGVCAWSYIGCRIQIHIRGINFEWELIRIITLLL